MKNLFGVLNFVCLSFLTGSIAFGAPPKDGKLEAKKTESPVKVELTKKEKSELKKWQVAVDDKSSTENQWPKDWCGKNLPLKIDESLVRPFLEAGYSAKPYCLEVRTKLALMCRDAEKVLKNGNGKDNKVLVNKLFNKVDCTLSKVSEEDVSFKLDPKTGTLTVFIGTKGSNLSETLVKYLYEEHDFNDGSLH